MSSFDAVTAQTSLADARAAAAELPVVDAATVDAFEAELKANPLLKLLSDSKGKLVFPQFALVLNLDLEGHAFGDIEPKAMKGITFDGKSLWNPLAKKPAPELANGQVQGFLRPVILRLIRSLSALNESPIYILAKDTERVALQNQMTTRIMEMACAEIGAPEGAVVDLGEGKTMPLNQFFNWSSWTVTDKQEAEDESDQLTTFLSLNISAPCLVASPNPAKFVRNLNGTVRSMLEKAGAELSVFVNVTFSSTSFANAEVRSFVDQLLEEAGYELESQKGLEANLGNVWVPGTKKALQEMLGANDMVLYCVQEHEADPESEDEGE